MPAPIVMGRHWDRADLIVHAGKPVDHTIPIKDAAGVVQDVTSWINAAATVRANLGSPQVLHTFTVGLSAAGLRVSATAEQTALWPAAWPARVVPWEITATHPSNLPIFDATGWVTLYTT